MENERNFKYNLVLQEENPFTPAQKRIINTIIGGTKTSYKEIAQSLGRTPRTIRNEINGTTSKPGFPKSSVGIFGVTENFIGTRPKTLIDLIWILLQNNVLVLEENH